MEDKNNSRRGAGGASGASSDTGVYVPAKSRGSGAKPSSKNKKSEEKPVFVQRTRPRSLVLTILFSVIKTLVLVGVVLAFVGLGLVLGVAKAYVDTTPTLDLTKLTVSDRTSYIYDRNGNMITTFAGMEYRDWADIDEIPDRLKKALIAIEDVRFYKHGGLDFKRLFSAVVNTLRNSKTHGGSTITQQLIKNKILTNEQSYKRKIQEAYLAYELENTMSKDKILEAYMNDVYLGDSNYGFKTAAKDYFGKEMYELSLRECAMLAGMVQKPNVYNPRANTYRRFYEDGTNKMDVTDDRTDVVLKAMYDNKLITKLEYQAALREKVRVLQVSKQKQLYDMAYFVEYAIYDVETHLLKERGLSNTMANRSAVEKELSTGGYHIYLTVDPDIQNSVQQIITNWDRYPGLRNSSANEITDPSSGIIAAQPQAAAVIIDQHTGEIIALIGGREEPIQKRQWNRAYQSDMPVGSSIKPLAVYGPALECGVMPGTNILNAEIPIDGYGGERGYPKIGSRRYEGLCSIRTGVTQSLNIVAARTLFDYVVPERAAKYLEQLGVDRSRINVDGPGLALGTSGITPLEMSAAYACIANGGTYLEPMAFSYVIRDDGSVLLDANKIRERRRVFSEQTAYILTDMLKDVVDHGTGTNAQISGMTVAGKTGTNDDYTSVYFAGYTGYYTASLWIGHDKFSEKLATGSTGGNSAAPLWQAFMSSVHRGLSDKPIIDVSPQDIGVAKVAICPVSGKLATEDCMLDTDHTPVYDWVALDRMPNEYCDMHCVVDYCMASNALACAECPDSTRYQKCIVLIPSDSLYARLEDEMLLEYIPNAVRSDLSPADFIASTIHDEQSCGIHGSGGTINISVEELKNQANELITTVRSYLNAVQTLSPTDRALLEAGIMRLQEALITDDAQRIYRYLSELKRNYEVLSAAYPPVNGPDPTPTPTNEPGPPPTEPPYSTPEPNITPSPFVTIAPRP